MARNIFTKGTAITLAWHFTKPDGSSFDLSGYSLRLFYAVGSRYTEVQGFLLGTNATSGLEDFISWVFAADKQFTAGDYKMKLQLYQNGKLFTTFNYNDAFALYQGTPNSSNDEEQTEEAGTVNLYTAAEFYLFNPIIPVVGSDGFWYVNGVRVLDGDDNPVPSYYNVIYDEDTRWLSIYKGNPDDPGTPEPEPIQVIKDVDDALKHWNEQYLAEEGSLAESEAGEQSRWGQYKMNEGTLEGSEAGDSDRWGQYQSSEAERETKYAAAEGTSSSLSTDNNRWGKYKAAESTRNVQYTQQEGSKAGSSAGGSDRWGQYKTAEAARDAERLTAEGSSSSGASENSRWGKYKAAENARDAARLTAEGNSGSTAGDGSRWGAYKTAENSRDAARLTAEGSAASTAGDGSRWGAYKTAEAARDTARETAEGSASSEAGDGTRWGAYKTAEANRNIARETAEGSASSEAGDGTRWGAYKTAEDARNTAYADEEGSLAGSSATDLDRWGLYKKEEGSKTGSSPGDGSRWGEYLVAEAERDERIVALEDAVFPLEAALSIQGNTTLLEYTGTAVSKDMSWAVTRQGESTTIDSMSLKQDSETIASGTSASGTQSASLNKLGVTAFLLTASKDTLSASKTLNVEMVRKMYFGFADSTLTEPTLLTAQTLKSSPVGTYTMSNGTAGKYLWLCVGTNKTINGVTSGGFEVPMEDAETIGNYKCYRSSEALAAGSITFTII